MSARDSELFPCPWRQCSDVCTCGTGNDTPTHLSREGEALVVAALLGANDPSTGWRKGGREREGEREEGREGGRGGGYDDY